VISICLGSEYLDGVVVVAVGVATDTQEGDSFGLGW
jgi:hypothetical protein